MIVEILAEPKRRAAEILARRPDVADVEAFGERLHATLAGSRRRPAGGRRAPAGRGAGRVGDRRPAGAAGRSLPRGHLHRKDPRGGGHRRRRGGPMKSTRSLPVCSWPAWSTPTRRSRSRSTRPSPGRGGTRPASPSCRPCRTPPRPDCKERRPSAGPVWTSSASYTRNSDVPELVIIAPGPPPARQTVFPNIPDNYRARAGLALPLYTGGRIGGGIDAARARARGRPPGPRRRHLRRRAGDRERLLVAGRRPRERARPARVDRLLRRAPQGRAEPLRRGPGRPQRPPGRPGGARPRRAGAARGGEPRRRREREPRAPRGPSAGCAGAAHARPRPPALRSRRRRSWWRTPSRPGPKRRRSAHASPPRTPQARIERAASLPQAEPSPATTTPGPTPGSSRSSTSGTTPGARA